MNGEVVFVGGIDTEIGKTVVTGWLARQWRDEGMDVITQKLVQTGCVGASDDILLHRRIMGCGLFDEDRDGDTMPALAGEARPVVSRRTWSSTRRTVASCPLGCRVTRSWGASRPLAMRPHRMRRAWEMSALLACFSIHCTGNAKGPSVSAGVTGRVSSRGSRPGPW